MLVGQEIEEEGGEEEHVKDITTGNAAQRDDTTAHGEDNDVTRMQALVDKKKVVLQRLQSEMYYGWMMQKELIACPTKRFLQKAPILIAPNWDLPFKLMCDASNFAKGAVLGQRHEKHF
nr:reverse transcriptase domain-containing protein [Tanacetum cinerariifolium]